MNKKCGVYSVVLLHGCREIVPLLLVQFLCACLQLVFAGGLRELIRKSDALFCVRVASQGLQILVIGNLLHLQGWLGGLGWSLWHLLLLCEWGAMKLWIPRTPWRLGR